MTALLLVVAVYLFIGYATFGYCCIRGNGTVNLPWRRFLWDAVVLTVGWFPILCLVYYHEWRRP